MNRKKYLKRFVVSLLMTMLLLAFSTPFTAMAQESDAVNSSSGKYRIFVPEESAGIVVMSPEKDRLKGDAVVLGGGRAVCVTDEIITPQSEDVIVEKNITFDANDELEEDGCPWVTRDIAEKIYAENDADWNYDMIHVTGYNDFSGEPIKIAVLDSGIDYLTDVNIAGAVNLVEEDQDLEPMLIDLTGHGSAVAGIINAIDPTAMVYSVRVLDGDNRCSLSRVVSGIYWCIENGIDIINFSFGTQEESEILAAAIADAAANGILMVAAAGNDNTLDADFPARYPEVISAGSVDYDGSFSDNNTYGTNIELLAPGENIFAQSMLGLYTGVAGTSIAAPHVTGIASLLWQKDRSRSADFIRGLMDASSNAEVVNNSEAGAGLVDLENALAMYDKYEEGSAPELVPEGYEETEVEETEFAEEGDVNASWESDEHTWLVDHWIQEYRNGGGTITDRCVNALKNGAVYPDNAGLNHIYHGGRKTNWIGIYKYTMDLAKTFRTSVSSLTYPARTNGLLNSSFDNMVSLVQHDITFDGVYNYRLDNDILGSIGYKSWNHQRILGNCDYDTLYNAGNYEAVARLKSFFVYGIALHGLSDTFAHASYEDINGIHYQLVHESSTDPNSEDYPYLEEYHTTDADNPDDAPFRWTDCKYAAQKVIEHAISAEPGLVADFSPHVIGVNRGYYLHKIVDKALAIYNSSNYITYFSAIDHVSEYFNS